MDPLLFNRADFLWNLFDAVPPSLFAVDKAPLGGISGFSHALLVEKGAAFYFTL